MKISWEKLGANIRAERKRQGMSIEALAERAGATADYVTRAESGGKQITLLMLLSFCDALGVEPNDLLSGVDA